MLKKIFIFICTLFLSTSCYAFNGVIDGFRGIYWGDSIETARESGVFSYVTQMECPNSDGYAFYDAKLSNPCIGEIQLDGSASLTFKDNQFSSIMLYYGKNTNPTSTYYMLFKKFKSMWGEPIENIDTTNTKNSLWAIGNVYIAVTSEVYPYGRADSLQIGTIKYVD